MSKSQQQHKTWNRSTIVALAVAGVLGLTHASADAQTRVDRSGATDANSRVGSNGRNDNRGPRPNPWEVNNAIVYGNVTGGKQFRGNLSSRDAREFRGTTANRGMDNFVRDSSGVTTNGIETFNANRSRAYFGDGRGVAPPPGFVGINSLGAYTAPTARPWNTVDPRQQALSSGTISTVVRPDQFGAPGAMDLQYAPGALMISPYTRQQSINPALLSDYTQLNRTGASALAPGDLANLRAQGQDTALGAGPNSTAGRGGIVNPGGADNRGPNDRGPGAGPQQQQPPNAINDAVRPTNPVEAGAISDAVRPGTVNNAVTPGMGTAEPGMRRTLPGMQQESSTYSALADRRAQQDQAKRPGQANEDASRAFNDQMRAQNKAKADAANADQPKPGTDNRPGVQPGGQPGNPGGGPGAQAPTPGADLMVKPGDLAPRAEDLRPNPADLLRPGGETPNADRGNAAPGNDNKATGGSGANVAPLKVGTLAGTTGSKGVNDLMSKAEQQMREGKYASAIESYDAAETLTPGNPLIKLGRAHAELGGAYYRRAETSLRRTLEGDKNLLAGQYDLKAFLGEERLQAVEKDLRELMTKNPNDVGAAMLLAYVYYNTGDERRAAAQLDLADKRGRGEDKFIKLLKDNWALPKDGAAPADNK